MSSILEIGNNKIKCQKYTPDCLVDTMLELAGYKTKLMGKTILENSFGTGKILKAIVVRYIEDAIKSGFDKTEISKGLAQDVYGVELDKELYENCIADLNSITQKYDIPIVDWKLYNENALTIKFETQFDYIIGNPPYITYKEMDKDSREALKEKFNSCSIGKFDYCYAFIELGVSLLNDTGKLVQLIPNNIYKNVFGKKLRNILVDHICSIYDYPNQRLFDKTLTSVSVFLYDKGNTSDDIKYKNITECSQKTISRKNLGEKWIFGDSDSKENNMLRFGDIFNASITIATLYNKAFLVDKKCIEDEKLETAVIKDAVSPRTLRYQKNKKIIFPYKYDENGLHRYSDKEFEYLFPNVVKHLKSYSEKLNERNSDENAAWFEYGRSQALAHINKEKLLISTIITNDVDVYKIDAETIPFSGIYITVKNQNYCLEDAIAILKSKQFMEYVRCIGINVSGKSLRITCNDINNYKFLGGQ